MVAIHTQLLRAWTALPSKFIERGMYGARSRNFNGATECVAKCECPIFPKNPLTSPTQQGNAQCMEPTTHDIGNPIAHGIVEFCKRILSLLLKKERRSTLKPPSSR